jgi:AAA+ superfamily predicted ATPase
MSTNDNTTWSHANQQYLMGMVKMIRAQLEKYSRSLKEKNEEPITQEYSSAKKELEQLSEAMPSLPALDRLVATLQLSAFERDILLLCAGVELDAGLGELIASLHGESSMMLPTFSLALAALPDPHWSVISPGGPLRYWRLIEVNKTQLVTRSPVRIDEHILHYLAGINDLHEKLKEIADRVYSEGYLVASQLELADRILHACTQKKDDAVVPVIQFLGTDRSDKITIAAHICSRLGLALYTISGYAISVNSHDISELTRLWNREAALNGYAMFLDCNDIDPGDKSRIQSLMNLLENIQGLVLLNGDQWTPELKRERIVFEIEKPTPREQLLLWQKVSEEKVDPQELQLEKLVSQFNLSANTIRTAGHEFFNNMHTNGSNGNDKPGQLQKKLWKVCCNHTRPQVDELAERIEPVAGWDDIVLPEAQKNILKEIAAQVKQRNKVYEEWGFAKKGSRGLGISALFAGESGTGKTMASEVLANELQLDLYKIDLSKVVNKYIGETEKNLKKVFDAAEDGGAILLFDEADALFGKRSDVKDSHDRYSNIEVSYLLQRMESYMGLAILTTNMKSALDKAFLRRIRFVIQFPFPDSMQRAEIWNKIFPAATPKKDIDVEKLARLNLPGGSIRNIAMNAAFFAADEGKPVLMSHISRAAKTEYDKLEKPLSNMEIKAWQ